MQIWSANWVLYTWQVKTICPVSPSAGEGAGISPFIRGVCGTVFRVGVAGLVDSWNGGEETRVAGATGVTPSGVAACNVANRSGVGEEAGRLHPAIESKKRNVRASLILLCIQFNGFKAELLTRQYFCAIASAIRTVDLFIQRMIFLEASHALHFCFDKTEMQPRLFRKCTFS